MKRSKVHFASFRCTDEENLQAKFARLLKTAGLGKLDFADKFVAIKLHFGEPGCLAYLRPNWARTLVDFIKERGGHPFLTDANTLYVGRRKHALEHLETAWENGFTPLTVGAPVIIADGLKGTDDVAIAVPNAKYISRCVGCGKCTRECAHGACTLVKGKVNIDPAKCVGCGRCLGACVKDAILSDYGEPCRAMHGRIAEYAAAACLGKPTFHISFICDVSPHCDCHAMNDVPLVPDIGIAASSDPVALDQAAADLCNAAPLMPGCCLAGKDVKGDIFSAMHPGTNWHDAIAEGERIGLGTSAYDLVKIG